MFAIKFSIYLLHDYPARTAKQVQWLLLNQWPTIAAEIISGKWSLVEQCPCRDYSGCIRTSALIRAAQGGSGWSPMSCLSSRCQANDNLNSSRVEVVTLTLSKSKFKSQSLCLINYGKRKLAAAVSVRRKIPLFLLTCSSIAAVFTIVDFFIKAETTLQFCTMFIYIFWIWIHKNFRIF